MKRLTEKMVFCGLVIAWRFAAWPTTRSPLLVNATTEGVVRAPSEFSSDRGLAALHHGHAGVGRPEIDTENFSHM